MNYEQANAVKELAAPVNKVLKGLEFIEYLKKQKGGIVSRWKWQPKPGEWYLVGGSKDWMKLIPESGGMELGKHIPILEWETIEGILEKAGYKLYIDADPYSDEIYDELNGHYVYIYIGKQDVSFARAESRQKALMLAIIELGKEIKQ